MAKNKAEVRPDETTEKVEGRSSTRKRTDWEAVERDYRTGLFTLRELEAKHGADNGLISRKAKKCGWTQDLSKAIKAATNAKLVEEIVSKEISANQQKVSTTVLAAAEVNKGVILGHRSSLARISSIAGSLMSQIEQAAQDMPSLSEVIEMVRNPDENGIDRANDALRKAMARPQLVDDLKKLAEINERVIKGERQAFGLDEQNNPDADGPKSDRALTDAERAVRLYNMIAKAKGSA